MFAITWCMSHFCTNARSKLKESLKPSTRCAKYLDHGHAIHARNLLDELESPPPSLAHCPQCSKTLVHHLPGYRTLFRCKDCAASSLGCIECVYQSHTKRPFDRILKWDPTQRFWIKVTLAQINYEFRLGHEGKRCKYALSGAENLVVIHEHGVMALPIVYCACRDSRSDVDQLVLAGLWLATWERPKTATTISALETFHSLNLNGQMNVHDYLVHVKRQTDNVGVEDVLVSVISHRIYCCSISLHGFRIGTANSIIRIACSLTCAHVDGPE